MTTLDLVDGNAANDLSSGWFISLVDAGWAELFFNGFGDRALAVRRDAFLRVGGFSDAGHHAPVSEWVFLRERARQDCVSAYCRLQHFGMRERRTG